MFRILESLQSDSYTTSMALFTIISFIVFILLVIVAFTTSFRKLSPKNTVLILGISNAGKTALFTRMRFNKVTETHTSIKENEAQILPMSQDGIPLSKKAVHIVDIPGHERLRFKFTEFTPITRAIVFVIDSTTITRNIRNVAEYLYEILSDKHIVKNEIPILITCNKTDVFTAIPTDKVQLMIEAEINQLRLTRTASLEHQDANQTDETFLGFEGEEFKFDHVVNAVTFVGCSATNGDIENIFQWIADTT